MKLECPHCGTSIPYQNINIHRTLAVCPECNHVFDFGDAIPSRKPKHRKVRRPARMHRHESVSGLELTYSRVFSQDDKRYLILSLIIATTIGIILPAAAIDNAPILVLMVFGLLLCCALYVAASILVNTTRIGLDGDTLSVTKKPLFIPLLNDNRLMHTGDITQIFCEETEQSQKAGSPNRYYHVCARLNDGSRIILIKGLPQDHAFYIAQELEADHHQDTEGTAAPVQPLEEEPDALDVQALPGGDTNTKAASR